jgi:type VI secretion system secreted protein Hcp
MPMPFHMSITGTTQGNISEGACDQTGRENTILCQALDHKISIPKDIQSGAPTGKRVHGALKVTKVFDKASPKLFQALARGERLTEVKLEFYRINPTGNEELYFTIVLEDAIIMAINLWIPNCLDPDQASFTHMEDLDFSYGKIIKTWVIDGIEAEDSWLVPT